MPTKKSQASHEKTIVVWEWWKSKGKTVYVLAIGLSWGVVTLMLNTLFRWVLFHETSFASLKGYLTSTAFLIEASLFLVFGSFFFGLSMWHYNQWQYGKALKAKEKAGNHGSQATF